VANPERNNCDTAIVRSQKSADAPDLSIVANDEIPDRDSSGGGQFRVARLIICIEAVDRSLVSVVDSPGHAEVPEYCRSPMVHTFRDARNRTMADESVARRVSGVSLPVRASAGMVVANATGTMNVSANRSQPG
jgi:hypothetical protein